MGRCVIEGMREREFGRIVNIGSVNGQAGQYGQVNYCAAKAGAIGMTKAMAQEGARSGITVNAVAPGYIRTATTDVLSEKLKDTVRSWIPMGRFGEPEEVAPIIVFLCSEDARYMTGDVLRVDGGMAI